MSQIIDARVRLPYLLQPAEAKKKPDEYLDQYDAVLGVKSGREKNLGNLIEDMDRAGVDHAIIHAEYEYGDPADEYNEIVAEVVKNNPQRFSGFGTISMEHFKPMRAVKQVEKIYELGLIGINFQPSFFGVPIDDRRFYPVYAKASELGLPVALHTGINYSVIHPIRNDHPLQLDQVACDFPDLKIIGCHGGWPWAAEMVAVARKHPNVLMDFGGLSPKYIGASGSGWEVMHRFMNSLLANQILFATDWPVFPMDRAINEWKNIGLKPEVMTKLLGVNAERLISRK